MNTAPCLAAALLALAGCSDFPRDPDGTLERVEAAGVIRLGVVSGAAREPVAEARREVRGEEVGECGAETPPRYHRGWIAARKWVS